MKHLVFTLIQGETSFLITDPLCIQKFALNFSYMLQNTIFLELYKAFICARVPAEEDNLKHICQLEGWNRFSLKIKSQEFTCWQYALFRIVKNDV